MAAKPLKRSALEMIAEAGAAPAVRSVAKREPAEAVAPKPRTAAKLNVKQLSLYLGLPAYRQLREIAMNEDTKMHPLILEAIDMLFKSRNRPPLAAAEEQGS